MATQPQRNTRTSAQNESDEGLLGTAARTAGAIAGEIANTILGGDMGDESQAKKKPQSRKKTSVSRRSSASGKTKAKIGITTKTTAKAREAGSAVRKAARKLVSKVKKRMGTTRKPATKRK